MLLSRFKIQGHSMEPNFYQGEFVIVSSISYLIKGPKIGDVILFKDREKYILKRIVKIENQQYVVKGDNIKDSKNFKPILKQNILGKVIYRI